MMGYSYSINDIQGVKEQALGAGLTLLSTHAIKASFVGISRSNPHSANISKRPTSNQYDGFPSGHTSFVFSSAGFAHKRYGTKLSIPLVAIGTSVGISRIVAKKHTATQVLSGAALGFATSYLISTKYIPSNLSFYQTKAFDDSPNYHLQWRMQF